MEGNVTEILIKKVWKRCVTLPLNSLQRGMTLPFWCPLSLMTLPSEAAALPPPKKKRTFPKRNEKSYTGISETLRSLFMCCLKC